ncbi:hypothetical protein N6H14_33490 [Paenibacillus sp. CC-CFT747]|nr:hypothetical protein N6H14_33490 [Paenibacillus sp. CC-CFT747]
MKRGEDTLSEENRKAQAGKGPSRTPVRDRPGSGEGKERPVPPPDQPVQGETAGRSETMSRLLAAKKRRQ